jgi:hypothetical protein
MQALAALAVEILVQITQAVQGLAAKGLLAEHLAQTKQLTRLAAVAAVQELQDRLDQT